MRDIKPIGMVDGSPSSPLLIIGRAPGREELAMDKPLVGATGRLLWTWLGRVGIYRDKCYIINTIGEWPEGTNGEPSKEQLEEYWDIFDNAIARSSAQVILCLGRTAFWRTTGIVGGIEEWRGYLIRPADTCPISRRVAVSTEYKTTKKGKYKKGDKRIVFQKEAVRPTIPKECNWICPTLHPAGVIRSGFSNRSALIADLARVRRALKGELELGRTDYSTLPGTLTGGVVAVDIETPMGAPIIERIGAASSEDAWTALYDGTAARCLRDTLNDPTVVKVFHNAGFDVPIIERHGLPIRGPIFDTMLAAQMEEPDLYKGLNSVISLYLDTERHKHLSDSDPPKYNAYDAIRTYELYNILNQALQDSGQHGLFTKTVMPAMRVLMEMKDRGIMVDEGRRTQWISQLEVDEIRLLQRWNSSITQVVSPTSPTQMSKFLYGTLGLSVKRNKYGGWTTGEGAIRELIEEAPQHKDLLELYLEFKKVNTLRKTYGHQAIAEDGCVHPSYLPASKDFEYKDTEGLKTFSKGMAGTGRPTARDPNIQNQPPESRRIFMSRYGYTFLEADYSQLELRIAAALAGDATLLRALEGDVHEVTRQLLACDRTRAKNVMYGTLYGAGPKKLAAVLRARGYRVTEAECRELQTKLARAYPALWEWRETVVSRVSTEYALHNSFGRRRYFPNGRADAPAAIDFLPQSNAADMVWTIICPLDHQLGSMGGWLDALIHDSTLSEAPDTKLESIAQEVKGIMEMEFNQIAPGFRVPVNIKVGKHWGEDMKEL